MSVQTIPLPREPERPSPPRPDSRFDLLAQARGLWAHRVLILGCALILAALGAAYSLLIPVEFEASATVSLGAPSGGRPVGYTDSFVNVLQSQSVADRIVDEFKLTERNPPITSGALLANVLSVRQVPQTSLVRIVARLNDPALAGRIVTRVMQLGIEAARQLAQDEISGSERELKDALERAEREMHGAEEAYSAFVGAAQIEVLKADVEGLLAQRARYRTLSVQLQSERARLASAERELQGRQPTKVTTQSVDSSPALMEAARQAAPDRSPLGLEMKEERPDPVYTQLDSLVATTRTNVAALERESSELQSRAGAESTAVKRIGELHQKQDQLERLEIDRRMARKNYEDIAAKSQSTRLTILDRTPQFVVVDPGRSDSQPVSRYLTRNVLLGLVAGALFGIMIALIRAAVVSSPSY